MLLMLSDKGKYAVATEHRRFVWKEIVWPQYKSVAHLWATYFLWREIMNIFKAIL